MIIICGPGFGVLDNYDGLSHFAGDYYSDDPPECDLVALCSPVAVAAASGDKDRRDRTNTRCQTACEGRHNPRDTCQHYTPFKLLIAIINLHDGVVRRGPRSMDRIAIHHGLGLCPLYMIIGSGASALGTSPLFRGFRLGGSWEIIRTTKHSHFRLASRSPIPRTTDPNPRYKTETKFFTPNFQTS